MASQPANATISVEYTVRAYRQDFRHEAILPLMGTGMRELVMSVPGSENLVDETRDNTVLVTTALDENRDGLPIVRFLKPVVTLEDAAEGISDLQFPVRIGRDVFLKKNAANLTDDLHAELRAV